MPLGVGGSLPRPAGHIYVCPMGQIVRLGSVPNFCETFSLLLFRRDTTSAVQIVPRARQSLIMIPYFAHGGVETARLRSSPLAMSSPCGWRRGPPRSPKRVMGSSLLSQSLKVVYLVVMGARSWTPKNGRTRCAGLKQ